MLNYVLVGSNDIEKAKEFYDALFASVGIGKLFEHPSGGRLYGDGKSPMFGVVSPFDKEPATTGNGSMNAFLMESREQVDAFHSTALELGGSCEGAPGLRGTPEHSSYFAYVRDLDGNKLAAYAMA